MEEKINKLKEIVNSFNAKKILVVGDLMVDEFIWGESTRLSPEAPVPVVLSRNEEKIPGGALNVVNNLIGLGAKVYVSGKVGRDSMGDFIQGFLKQKDIDIDGIILSDEMPTIIKTRILAGSQQVVRLDRERLIPIANEELQKLSKYYTNIIPQLDGIIISDYAKGMINKTVLSKIISLARESNVKVAVDPQVKHFLDYKNVFTLTPNHHETQGAYGKEISNEEELIQAGLKLLKRLNSDSLLVTRGKDGMTLFQSKGRIDHIPTVARKVFDVTGAGDTVISVFLLACVSGASLHDAAILANIAAGHVVGEVGTATIQKSVLLRKIKQDYIP